MASLQSAEGALLEALHEQRQHAIDDLELFDTIVRALESMSPEGRALAITRLAKAFPLLEPNDRIRPSDNHAVAAYLPPIRSLKELDIKGMTYADAAYTLLDRTTKQQPLSTKVLINRMRMHGKKITGSDTYRILYRSLKNDSEKRFLSIRGRWALVTWFADGPPLKGDGERAADKDAEARGLLD